MNEITCIFCGIESQHVLIEENGYKGKKCSQCGLIYISPQPSFKEIVNLYGHDDAYISAESHIYAYFQKKLYARHHLRLIRSFIQSGDLLEIGAGAGYFLDEARKTGFNPHGLEFNPIQSNYIRKILGIPCEESPLNTSVFQGKKFDVVYLCDVISHFFDPISDFKTINKIMKDDSFLIIETGNLGDVDSKYFNYFHRFQYPDHLFFFSTDNLLALLRIADFDLIKIYRYSILPQLKMERALAGIKEFTQKNVFKTEKKRNFLSDREDIDFNLVLKPQAFNVQTVTKKSIKNIYHYMFYVLRYKVGRMTPKTNRPQTIIILARKRKQNHMSKEAS